MNNFFNFLKEHAASVIFWLTFCAAIALSFVGVLTPPPGIIDPSVVQVIRDLLLYGAFGTLAISQILK